MVPLQGRSFSKVGYVSDESYIPCTLGGKSNNYIASPLIDTGKTKVGRQVEMTTRPLNSYVCLYKQETIYIQ